MMKFSIITVCYNSKEFIDCAINSVLSQSNENIEYIIIDGASIDGTVSIIQPFGDRLAHFVSEPDNGIYDAINKGLALARGDVIGLLNSDDFYANPSVITDVAKQFEINPGVDMVFGNISFVRHHDLINPVRFYSSYNFKPWMMRFGFMPAHPATFIRRRVYENMGGYKLGYKIAADFEWFVRAILIYKYSYIKINKTLVRMREGGVSTSGIKSYWLTSKEQLRALRENRIYSNLAFILLRLPIKFFHKILRKAS